MSMAKTGTGLKASLETGWQITWAGQMSMVGHGLTHAVLKPSQPYGLDKKLFLRWVKHHDIEIPCTCHTCCMLCSAIQQ